MRGKSTTYWVITENELLLVGWGAIMGNIFSTHVTPVCEQQYDRDIPLCIRWGDHGEGVEMITLCSVFQKFNPEASSEGKGEGYISIIKTKTPTKVNVLCRG